MTATQPKRSNTMTATQPNTQQLREIALAQIFEDPQNPRKTLGDLTGLVESMRAHGFRAEHPLLARTIPGDLPRADPIYRLISGHRRHRAATLAGLSVVPCVIDDTLDTQAILEVQLVENAQRSDVHPLDEADAIVRLRDEFDLSMAQIANRIGKSASHVARRLSLERLCHEGREAYGAEKITLEIAVELSRLPSVKMQTEALEEVIGTPDEIMERTPKEIIGAVRDRYFLRMAKANWSLDDATLDPAAGSCLACSKRTGSQPALFADLAGDDTCTDAPCFRNKAKLAADRRVSDWQAKGATLVTQAEAKTTRLFGLGSATYRATLANSSFIELTEECYEDGSPEDVTWATLIGAHVLPKAVTVAIDPQGIARELVLRDHAKDLLKTHYDWARDPEANDTDSDEDEEEGDEVPHSAPSRVTPKPMSNAGKWEAERAAALRLDLEVSARAFALSHAGAKGLSDIRLFRAACEQLASSLQQHAIITPLLARYAPKAKSTGTPAQRAMIADAYLDDLRSLLVSLVVANVLESLNDWDSSLTEIDGSAVLGQLGIDPAVIARNVKDGKPAPKSAAKPAAKGKPGPKVGTKPKPAAKAGKAAKATKKAGRK